MPPHEKYQIYYHLYQCHKKVLGHKHIMRLYMRAKCDFTKTCFYHFSILTCIFSWFSHILMTHCIVSQQVFFVGSTTTWSQRAFFSRSHNRFMSLSFFHGVTEGCVTNCIFLPDVIQPFVTRPDVTRGNYLTTIKIVLCDPDPLWPHYKICFCGPIYFDICDPTKV